MPTSSTATTSTGSARRSSRCFDMVAAGPRSATIPRTLADVAGLGSRTARPRQAKAAQRRPAADRQRRGLPGRLLRVTTCSRATSRRRRSSAPRSGPMSQGSGLVLLFHSLGEHDGAVRLVGVPQGRQRRLHPGAGPRRAGVRRRDPARVAGRPGADPRRPGDRRRAGGRHRAAAPTVVVSALDPRRTFLELVDPRELPDDLVENIRRMKFQGVSAKVNFALDGLPRFPALRRPRRPVPRLPQHRPVDRVPRASLRRRQVRLVQPAALHRRRDPVDDRPGHGAARQARHVVLRPVRAVRAQGQRLGHRARELRRHGAGHAGVATSRASATWSSSARS